MSVLTPLFDEHRLILRVTDAFENYLKQLPTDSAEVRQDLHRFVTFYREFVDLVHHEKEEAVLMPAMVKAGCDWDSADFEHLRKDHNQERYLMRVIRQAAAQRGLWTGEDLRHLKSVGQELVDFMRAHVDLENSKIYPVAMELLQGERGEQLTEAFQDFERARRSHGHDGFLNELAEELVRDYSGEQVA
ncbi:MAG: hemerythrin domain-containing protein [Polyangiaceae bacterium]